MSGCVCVVGTFMVGFVTSAPRRPVLGEALVGTDSEMRRRGEGLNQAVAATHEGAQTSMVGLLGRDQFRSEFRSAHRAETVTDPRAQADAAPGSGVDMPVVEPRGRNSIIIDPRANGLAGHGGRRQHRNASQEGRVITD